ncbi:hypothetical protein BDM02DRAFT_3125046 [Thelephora ganbajun]|uniref:Uncharacterized protein n=1 Tax=Thelephora ganbajun TaxID=370292 RepID=A0ACB6ZWX5_THEGA|nr:hypothetical protein BDM02DRAFT_3125046 [Thelephora ganbajun]
MSPPPRWFTALSKLFQEYPQANVTQLATIDKTVPRVRSCIIRELISPEGNEHLPIILTTTDIRTPKVEQILANDTAQVNWWIESSMDQFRLTGKVTLVPEPANRVFHSAGNIGFERLSAGGFDWEVKRVQVFDSLSGHMRASWCRPIPGSPMKGGYGEAKKWPETIPTTTGVTNEREKKLVEQALGNFALILIEPTHVDWVRLGVMPDQRTFFHRGDDESWTETIVVP